MIIKKTLLLLTFISLVIASAFSQGEEYIFPADAGALDVTKEPYNADNTGVEDATAAIQAALDAYPNGNRTIYLPNGTYLISNTLRWPEGSGGSTYKRTMIQGQSKEGSIIKLQDNCPGFQDPDNRKAMIYTGPAPAQRFRNAIRAITVNTGTGNPGASGIQFNASNEGTMQHVNIISGDGQGVYGLDLAFTNEIGPAYVYDLTVEGFNIGIMHGFAINSVTFEKITLRNQNICGFRNGGNVSPIRGFVSENTVSAVENKGVSSTMILVDAELTGGNDTLPAIFNSGTLYARNIQSAGYNKTIESKGGLAIDMEGPYVKEYNSHGLYKQFQSPAKSLNLPVKELPQVAWSDLSEWANVMTYGALGDGSTDDRQAIQDAIDSGKETVYFPGGYNFKFNDTIYLRGNVKRVIGVEGRISGNGTFLVGNDIPDTLVFERLNALYANVKLVNKSSKTLMIDSQTAMEIVSYGNGDMFLVNNVFGVLELHNPDQNVWVRHLNTEEGNETNIVNDGADLWILGYKTERGKTKIHTKNGGRTELLGSHNYSTTGEKTDPWFIIENASMSIAGARETNYNSAPYTDYVTEIRGDQSKTISRLYFPASGAGGGVIPLYNGYTTADELPESPANLSINHTGVNEWFINWNEVAAADVDYYSLYVAEVESGPYQMIANYLQEPGVVFENSKYANFYFVATTVDENGIESEWSDMLTAVIEKPGAPANPTGLEGIAMGDSIVLSWNANAEFELDYYEVYRSAPPSSFFLLQQTGIQDTSWTDHSVDAGKAYRYTIRAASIYDEKSGYSDTITIFPAGDEAIPGNMEDIRIFPNPAEEYLIVNIPVNAGSFKATVMNIEGKIMIRENFKGTQAKLDLQGIKPGVYFLKVETEGKDVSTKFIVGER